MALKDVLSAVRQLLLDDNDLPETPDDRFERLASRFPDLSEVELRDLAAIPPARLRVYTHAIFAGERSILKWMFPMSFAAVRRLSGGADGDEVQTAAFERELVRDLHTHRPWSDASSRTLAGCFSRYIAEDRTDLTARWPALPEFVEAERISVDVLYGPDTPFSRLAPLELEQLRALSVEQLMERRAVRPAFARLIEFQYDIPALEAAWRENEELPEALPGPRQSHAVCTRAEDRLMTRWVPLSAPMHGALSAVAPESPVPINTIALAFLEASDAGLDQEQLFVRFFDEIQRLFAHGALRDDATA